MNKEQRRDSFRSRWGFKLACIGSAVGMGNIWLFPSRMSQYGGATFLIPYLLFVALIAATGVIGEMAFGRATGGGPIVAFGAAAQQRTGSRTWGQVLGLVPVLGSLAMAIGYSVVVGWILKYAVAAFTGGALENQGVEGFTAYFNTAASAWGNTGWQIEDLTPASPTRMYQEAVQGSLRNGERSDIRSQVTTCKCRCIVLALNAEFEHVTYRVLLRRRIDRIPRESQRLSGVLLRQDQLLARKNQLHIAICLRFVEPVVQTVRIFASREADNADEQH